MNILIIGPYPPPYGGISSLIKSLVGGFKRKDVNSVVILYFGNNNKIRNVDGAIVYERSVSKNAWQILNPLNWSLLPSLIKIYSGNNLSFKDYMNIFIRTILTNKISKKHNTNTTSFYQSDTSFHLLLCKELWGKSISIILTVFGEIYDQADYLITKKNLLLEMLYKSDAVISSSCYCAESFKIVGNDRQIEVIYVGVSVSRFSNIEVLRGSYRKNLEIKASATVLLFMGRFSKEMGLHGILEMFPSLLKSQVDFHLILAGASGELVDAAQECKDNYPDKITVVNNISFDLQPSLYAAADLLLAPSRDKHACMGVSIKEAMAAGIPVIASDSGGIPEAIIHNETGVIVPLQEDGENNLKEFEQAIITLSLDEKKRKKFALNALKRAKDIFSEEETLDRTLTVFKKHAPSQ
jgi:glycosyltransferase involved in cell wall biosynthesis